MNPTDPYRRPRMLVWLLPFGIVSLAIYIAGVRAIAPDEWFLCFFMLTAFAMTSGIALGLIFPKSTRRRKALQWVLLVPSTVLVALHVASNLQPTQWGRPGRSIDLDFQNGEVRLEIDYSNETSHDISHGSPGYWRAVLPTGLMLLILLPLTLIMWFDVIDRKFPWLKSRYPPGHCQTCGYNLTGNVSGICPECGTRISSNIP